MVLVHVPRVLVSVAKGLYRHRMQQGQQTLGFHPESPAVYRARAGLFDVDYLGHMNNAAFLSHAEYARWEMVTESGSLQAMFRSNTHFMVAGAFVRYRREIRPLFRKFTVETHVAGLDARNIWIVQNFRVLGTGDADARIRAQLVVQGLAVHDRKVVDPREFFADRVGVDPDVVRALDVERDGAAPLPESFARYAALDRELRAVAAEDDERHRADE